MTEAMPFLQKYDITFLRPPTIRSGRLFLRCGAAVPRYGSLSAGIPSTKTKWGEYVHVHESLLA